MQVIRLDVSRLGAFLEFCASNRDKVDGSFLADEDLSGFTAGDADPTFLLTGSGGCITGVASLMLTSRAISARRARFRILWCMDGDKQCYASLLNAMSDAVKGINSAYLFAPLEDAHFNGILDELGFIVERNVYSLKRSTALPRAEAQLPNGLTIRPFVKGQDEVEWCNVRNSAFATVKGNEAPQSAEEVLRMASSPDSIEGAMLMIEEGGRTIAVARGSADEMDGRPSMNIGPIAVLPEKQGMGLGRALLRSLVMMAYDMGLDMTTLSVNADNEAALKLYISEGFTKMRSFACRSVRPSAFL